MANYTACPGDALYRLLPGVRTAVGGMGLPKIYDFNVGTIEDVMKKARTLIKND